MPQDEFAFTVFTPTYNRAHTLARVYQSLQEQTFADFEWLVVDDGSSDNTAEVVSAWQEQAPFLIRYYHQKNQGKHIAFNQGVRRAQGQLFLVLDSDDACLPQALERLWFHWQQIPPPQRESFAGVAALCQDESGRVVGDNIPQPQMDSDAVEIRRRYKLKGEHWGFVRTSILRQFPYPENPDMPFIPEGVVWSQIASRYRTRFINEPLRVYFQGADQLTKTGFSLRHAPGLALWHQVTLNLEGGWWRQDPWGLLRSALNYARFSFLRGRGVKEQGRGLETGPARFLWLAALLPGWLAARRDRRRL
jgi:glycosyltransferase involved in cell wall biosynthesis